MTVIITIYYAHASCDCKLTCEYRLESVLSSRKLPVVTDAITVFSTVCWESGGAKERFAMSCNLDAFEMSKRSIYE